MQGFNPVIVSVSSWSPNGAKPILPWSLRRLKRGLKRSLRLARATT